MLRKAFADLLERAGRPRDLVFTNECEGIGPRGNRIAVGNRSAIDWVLDQHKEKTPRDPTVAAKSNTYRFADTRRR